MMLQMIGAGRLARRVGAARASRSFAEACARAESRPVWVGLEHEFLVFEPDQARADFRTVIHRLQLGRPDLVPADRNAYRLATGSIVTADTTEAEIATPPVELHAGFAKRLDAWAAYERDALAVQVRPLTLVGDSTHLNIALPDDVDADRIADLFATRFSPGLMLLMDRRTSPGLLVRPRPYRLELGGEYVVGNALRAALAYAAGATLACIEAVRRPHRVALPAALAVRLERGAMRYGWYVDRRAFGGDLYGSGRATPLVSAAGVETPAQQHIGEAWAVARDRLAEHVAVADLRDADDMVAGRTSLPVERAAGDQEIAIAPRRRPRSPFGVAMRAQRRPSYDLAPVMVSWQAAVFLALRRDGRRAAFVAVPGGSLGSYLDHLGQGHLDPAVEAFLALEPAHRRLSDPRHIRAAGLYDELGLRTGLLAAERDHRGRSISYRLPQHSVPASAGLA